MRRTGFSLIELMVTVALLGILASIGYPFWLTCAHQARRAEAKPILRGIGDAQTAYDMAQGTYLTGASNPGVPLDKDMHAFDAEMAGWVTLGFSPDGPVRCTYLTDCYDGCTWARADAYCDVDDDNNVAAIWYYIADEGATGGGAYSTGHFEDQNPDWF